MWVLTQWNDAVNLQSCTAMEIHTQVVVDAGGERTEYQLIARFATTENILLAKVYLASHAEELREELILRLCLKSHGALTNLRDLITRLETKK